MIERVIEVGADGLPQLNALINTQSGYNWCLVDSKCDFRVEFANQSIDSSKDWRVSHTERKTLSNGATQLAIKIEHTSGLTVTQFTTCFSDKAVIEHQCRISNEGSQIIKGLQRFDPLVFSIQAPSSLQSYTIRRDKYELFAEPLKESLTIKGGMWNGPEHAGWLVLENKKAEELLYIGIEWEREWEVNINKVTKGYEITAGLVRYSRDLAPNESVESPRIFVGLTHGELDDAVQHMQEYMTQYIFLPELPNFPWVSYDIWSTDKENVEEIILKELDFALDMGVELFYIDASWYSSSSIIGEGSWGLGLGNYEEDRRKFPRGIKHLSDQVHQKGLKFGLWVDPIIIDEQWLKSGLYPEHWLIQENGVNRSLSIKDGDWPTTLHLCTGCPEVVEYIYGKLAMIVEKYNLEWLKWDDSALNNPYCNRTDHGHQAGDGNFSALKGKYEICRRLIEQFPDLVIEQCGYPARLDYGLSRYARTNWLSDATSNSIHVRSNLQVTRHVFPASYNSSFIVYDKEILEENDPKKLDTLVRSRLMGMIGLATLHGKLFERASLWPTAIHQAFKRNVKVYKTFRHLLSQHSYQISPPKDSEGWHLNLFVSKDKHEAVMFCFPGDSKSMNCRVMFKGLIPNKYYKVQGIDTGDCGMIQGKELMEQGLDAKMFNGRSSEIYILN